MTERSEATSTAEVWGSTWIPVPSPVKGFGNDAGYSVAWVQSHDGSMLQALVDAAETPAPGTTGEVQSTSIGDESIDVFTPAAGAGA